MTAVPAGRVLWPLTAWCWALQFAVFNPILAVLLVTVYGADDAQVGLALGAYNVGGFIASLLIPAAADHRRDYLLPLLLCSVAGVALVAALALVPTLPFAVVALVLLGGPPSVGSSLLFAQLRDAGAPPEQVVRTRAIVSFAWVVGPLLATAVTGLFSERAALWLLGAITLVNLLTSVLLLRARRRSDRVAGRREGSPSGLRALRQVRLGPTLLVLVAFVALQATNVATVTVTGLFVTESLGASIVWAGIALGAAALLEIPALLLIGRLLRRVSPWTLVAGGSLLGAAYYAVVAVVPDPVLYVAAQPLNAAFFAVVAGVGLTVFQDVFPAPGLASGLFTNTRRIGAMVSGGLIAAVAPAPDSYRALFVASAVIAALVLAGVLVARSPRRASLPSR